MIDCPEWLNKCPVHACSCKSLSGVPCPAHPGKHSGKKKDCTCNDKNACPVHDHCHPEDGDLSKDTCHHGTCVGVCVPIGRKKKHTLNPFKGKPQKPSDRVREIADEKNYEVVGVRAVLDYLDEQADTQNRGESK